MKQKEYMKLPYDIMPQKIIDQYNLAPLAHTNGYIYIKISKGMYRLHQAGRIANDQLQKHLKNTDITTKKKRTDFGPMKPVILALSLWLTISEHSILLTIISNTQLAR